jgi:hypothetical protein
LSFYAILLKSAGCKRRKSGGIEAALRQVKAGDVDLEINEQIRQTQAPKGEMLFLEHGKEKNDPRILIKNQLCLIPALVLRLKRREKVFHNNFFVYNAKITRFFADAI